MVTETRSVVAWGQRWGGVWDSGMDYKGAWGNNGDDGYVHYLVCADDFTSMCSLYTYVRPYPQTFSTVHFIVHQLYIKAVIQKKNFFF